MTGGFRTAAAMVQAIKENATDGIGLGRPITAEPGDNWAIVQFSKENTVAGGLQLGIKD